MNPVELYKKLPKTNCGLCRPKACMPFAFALLKGEVGLSDCPHLDDKQKNEIQPLVKTSDWREDLIAKFKQDVQKIGFSKIANRLGASINNGKLVIKCFGAEVEVDPNGEISSVKKLSPWMKMLVLFYIKNGDTPSFPASLSGKWVLHNELRGGMMKHKAFMRECEDPLRELFDHHFERVTALLDEYGAGHPAEFATPNAWLIYLFPQVPVIFLYWPADDEFESKVTIRFDSTADSCFDVEQLIFLIEELIKEIEASL